MSSERKTIGTKLQRAFKACNEINFQVVRSISVQVSRLQSFNLQRFKCFWNKNKKIC